jgi:hypothetical protein
MTRDIHCRFLCGPSSIQSHMATAKGIGALPFLNCHMHEVVGAHSGTGHRRPQSGGMSEKSKLPDHHPIICNETRQLCRSLQDSFDRSEYHKLGSCQVLHNVNLSQYHKSSLSRQSIHCDCVIVSHYAVLGSLCNATHRSDSIELQYHIMFAHCWLLVAVHVIRSNRITRHIQTFQSDL